jgi:hypothetical protein
VRFGHGERIGQHDALLFGKEGGDDVEVSVAGFVPLAVKGVSQESVGGGEGEGGVGRGEKRNKERERKEKKEEKEKMRRETFTDNNS